MRTLLPRSFRAVQGDFEYRPQRQSKRAAVEQRAADMLAWSTDYPGSWQGGRVPVQASRRLSRRRTLYRLPGMKAIVKQRPSQKNPLKMGMMSIQRTLAGKRHANS